MPRFQRIHNLFLLEFSQSFGSVDDGKPIQETLGAENNALL